MGSMTTATAGPARCHACGAEGLAFDPRFPGLARITSDCQPWPMGGRIGCCPACGLIQKAVDAVWLEEIGRIYANYAIYHQGGGAEQAVFVGGGGEALERSDRILRCLLEARPLAPQGRWLDVGCGNGAMLRALSRHRPGWSLMGQEINDKYREEIEAIPGVERLQVGPLPEGEGSFSALSLIHVLEHIPDPVAALKTLRGHLAPGGMLLIEVPHVQESPFDLLIADHVSHFSPKALAGVVEAAGFSVEQVVTDWVPKEITLIATPGMAPSGGRAADPSGAATLAAQLVWLTRLQERAQEAAAARPFGIFGTSIAGTWLASQLQGRLAFFVDEAASQPGRQHLGLPVYRPAEVEAGSTVFLAFPPAIADKITARMAQDHGHFRCVAP